MRLRTALFLLIAWTAFGQRLVRLQCVLNAFGESFGLPFSFTLWRGAVLTQQGRAVKCPVSLGRSPSLSGTR
jgi:hypothetical protein